MDPSSSSPRLHKRSLRLEPQQHERAYWVNQSWLCVQHTALDVLNCISVPVLLAVYIQKFQTSPNVVAVWACVVAAKGYRLGLMLLPSAREARAYEQYRYAIVVVERVLLQLVSMYLMTRGPGPLAHGWMTHKMQNGSTAAIVLKTLLVLGGVIATLIGTFWHPLDVVSQAALNTLFLVMFVPPAVAQVA